jgi:hypothetical protein
MDYSLIYLLGLFISFVDISDSHIPVKVGAQ